MSNIYLCSIGENLKGGKSKMTYYEYGCSEGSCAGCVEPRRFFTKEEKIKMLEDYKKALENEAKGVSERIAELKEEQA